jgi:hypothetical protein
MYNLGVVHAGRNEREEACRWWSRAAERGLSEALLNLGAVLVVAGEPE